MDLGIEFSFSETNILYRIYSFGREHLAGTGGGENKAPAERGLEVRTVQSVNYSGKTIVFSKHNFFSGKNGVSANFGKNRS